MLLALPSHWVQGRPHRLIYISKKRTNNQLPQARSTSKVSEHVRFSQTEMIIRQLQPHFGIIPASCCTRVLLLNCACFKDAGFDLVHRFFSAFCSIAFNAAVKQ